MKLTIRRAFGMVLSIASVTLGCAVLPAADALDRGFTKPPDVSKPSTFWWWFNSNVSKEGITRDLEEFRAKGIGGVVLINSTSGFGTRPIPKGPAFLSPEWRELFRHALREAERLDIEVGINLSTGWCMGGPWIKPENSGRWYLQSSMTVAGAQKFSGVLPLPGNRDGYDGAQHLFIKDYIDLPLEKLDYRDTKIIAFPESDGGKISGDRLKLLQAKSNRLDASSHAYTAEVMSPPLVPWKNESGDKPLAASDVIDLTDKVGADGRLVWDVPPGRWLILRTGHRMTGARTAYALPEADGLEVDWLDERGVEAQFAHLGKIFIDEASAAGVKVGAKNGTLRYFHSDSFEDGFPNWTAAILKKFRQLRGYDATPYLPVFAGRIVGSAEISDRFLYDYRRTVADLMADAHYKRFEELCRQHGMDAESEGAGPSWSATMCMDTLKNLGQVSRPMGEFWQDNYRFVHNGQNQVGKMVATASHIYGRRTAAAEAFTTFAHWSDDPAALKPTADRAFCEGINRIVFHTSTAQRPEDGKPGYEYGAGTHFNRNITWWNQAGGFVGYIGRCQHLLQSGLFVADVLYYNGDGAPNIVEPKHTPAGLGDGYDYDVCNTDVLLNRISVRDGRLVMPDGMSYRVLVLPDNDRMPVEVAHKIRDLVNAGATVIGPRPTQAPGLQNYPQCDTEVRAIAAEVWETGRVLAGKRERDVLAAANVYPDFDYDTSASSLDFIHRTADGAEIYFVVNRNAREDRVACTFRVSGKTPEIWDPVTGAMRDATEYHMENGRIVVPLSFAPQQSFFIVFRRSETPASGVRNFPEQNVVQEITGAWTLAFDPAWGGPAKIEFPSLMDWTLHRDEGIRYYSGTVTYTKRFDLASATPKDGRVILDLGVVKNLATVRLNGKSLGTVWTAPWQVDVTDAVKRAENLLEIEVVNLWPNRLIGDKYLAPSQKLTRTNIPLKDDAQLLPSGLIGPVRLLQERR